MEGILFKWTNYYNGWQPRYFVLNDKGILSYYKSKDLIDQGCKGSSLVNACELKVHPSDPLRFDLIIPGEQFFSLKAKNQAERQQWLLAIGACKAKGNPSTPQRTNSNPLDQELKMKIQELHLYQTVLTQGIHTLKSSINDRPVVDVKDLDQSRMMLGVTCDAFIQTLDECVKLANGNSSSLTVKSRRSRSSSASIEKVSSSSSPSSTPTNLHADEKHFRTFFSEISSTSTFPRRFGHFASLPLTQIHSELFLTICEEYFSLLEKFSSPTFIPLKADIHSNISKIRRKISIDPKKFESLASIVNDEILSNSNKEKNSATDALLWLTRNLQFLQLFFFEFGQKNCSVEEAMNKAYGHSLKPFHGWITRGIFSIAFRSVPYNEDFLRSLSNETNPIDDPRLEKQISEEMLEHSEEMKVLVEKIFQFYFEKKIFSNEIIG